MKQTHMKRIAFLCLALACFLHGPLAAQESGWRLERDKKGVQIHTRAVEGSAFREIRGTTRIEGQLSSIIAALQDMSFWPKLNEIIASAQLHQQLSDTESLIYMQMDMPWPVSDRDVLNRRKIEQDEVSKAVTLTEVATQGVLAENDDYVRIVQSTQRWTLTPMQDGSVEVVWTTHTDPNGPIPAAIVNMLSVGAPYDSLTTLRQTIQAQAYRDRKLAYISEP